MSTTKKSEPIVRKRYYFGTVTYLVLLFLLVLSSIISISGLYPQSDSLLIGFASIVAVYTVAFLLIRELPHMSRFEFGPGGVKAVFRELTVQALKVKDSESNPEVKQDIENIVQSDPEPSVAYINLANNIERRVIDIARLHGFSNKGYAPFYEVLSYLESNQIITPDLKNLLRFFWNIRNSLMHSSVKINNDDLAIAMSTGEIILSKLNKIV